VGSRTKKDENRMGRRGADAGRVEIGIARDILSVTIVGRIECTVKRHTLN